MNHRGRPMSPAKIIAIAFALIIALGTALLMLPISSRDGQSASLIGALFTATSATCVTGLTMYDTFTQWSGFGQGILLVLFEVGGLGFMSIATLFTVMFRKRVGLKSRMLMAQALSLNEMEGVFRLQKTVLFGSLLVQGIGALALAVCFWPRYGLVKAFWWGCFHAISAFCNAGFDILGTLEPGASLITVQDQPCVLLVLSALVIVGGLGFLVWEECISGKPLKKFSVYAKLVLITTAVLLIGGWLAFLATEWNNPATIGNMSLTDKLVNAFFESVTLRTAGFASIDQGSLTDGGKMAAIFLMLIGGSSGSTAGGLKTVTFVVVLLFMRTRARGKQTVTVFHRTIPQDQVMNAMTICIIMVLLSVLGAFFICLTSPVSLTDGLFEAVSALATVGVTAGATAKLSLAARILVILYMYFGRVGVLTISLGFLMGDQAEERYHYAQTNLLIG